MAEVCLLNREDIKRWILEHGGEPCVVSDVSEEGDEDEEGEKPDMLHICFDPDEMEMERISWDEFFDRLENENYALVYATDDEPHTFWFMDRDEAIQEYFPDSDLPDSGEVHVSKENMHSDNPPEDEPEI